MHFIQIIDNKGIIIIDILYNTKHTLHCIYNHFNSNEKNNHDVTTFVFLNLHTPIAFLYCNILLFCIFRSL